MFAWTAAAQEDPVPAETESPLVVWATSGWAEALGPARCEGGELRGMERAIRIAGAMKRSTATGGVGIASAGALGDHPLLAYFARRRPERLAAILADAGLNAIVLGVADVNGPLLRSPGFADALRRRGVVLVASNLKCEGQADCAALSTAEDPLPIVERAGRRYALIGLLPDDVSNRVEPAGSRPIHLLGAAETLIRRTLEARAAGADLVVASLDHGRDATAASNLSDLLDRLPQDIRPDVMLSSSAGEKLLFLRPLEVHPAVVGTRRGELTTVHATRLADGRDLDVLARSAPLDAHDADLAATFAELGREFCAADGAVLPSGTLVEPLDTGGVIGLAAGAARQLAGADVAVVDPTVFESDFSARPGTRLQRGEMRRAVVLDSPLVAGSVPIAWLQELRARAEGLQPVDVLGLDGEGSDMLVASRPAVPDARYRVVTTAVLARSGRLPAGADWSPITTDGRRATLRGALLAFLERAVGGDPRDHLLDPADGTEWVYRANGDATLNLAAASNAAQYEQPALKVDDTLEVGLSLQLRADGNSPEYLFENVAQAAFDRNYETRAIVQDLAFLRSTYTYRGWWPGGLFVPVPFAEGYVETEFDRGDAPYHHLLLRPQIGFRSLLTQVLSVKLSFGLQHEVLDPQGSVVPGLGAELVLKPWSVATADSAFEIEGNLLYYWSDPTDQDEHLVQGQLLAGIPVLGPLQLTISANGALRKDRGEPLGRGIGVKAGIRLRFVDRNLAQ